jgi:uncharacterized protein
MPVESLVSFVCGGSRLYGIAHIPDAPSRRGILMVHGRPAYRVGPHRLYVQLARAWAEKGIAVMRFDYRGTGDCEGEMVTFEETSQDIRAAVDAFFSAAPGLEEISLFGSCAGAADALHYAPDDRRVTGLVLANLWAYSSRERARTKIRYYASLYFRKIRNPAWWSKVFRGESRAVQRVRGVWSTLRAASGISPESPAESSELYSPRVALVRASYRTADFAARLADSLRDFRGRVLLILCGADVNAQSFIRAAESSAVWRKLLADPRLTRHDLPGADHGFRRAEWRDRAVRWTLDWLAAL